MPFIKKNKLPTMHDRFKFLQKKVSNRRKLMEPICDHFFYPCADQMRMHSCLANLGMGGSHQRQAQQKLFVVLRITRVCLLLDRTKRASLGTEGTVLCGLAHMRKNVCAHSRNVYPLCATVWKWVIRQTSSVQFMSLGLLQRAS